MTDRPSAKRVVLVAGATGALGTPLVRKLLASGYEVIGITRTPEKRAALERQGAKAVVADALDLPSLRAATSGLKADAVIHALTAIPKRGLLRFRDMDATNALRTQGTSNLLEVAKRVGARRFLAESMVLGYGYGDWGNRVLTEEQPLAVGSTAALERILAAFRSLEEQVREATWSGELEGVLLRFGYFYGVGAGSEVMARMLKRRMLPLPNGVRSVGSFIEIEDAAEAIVAALERGRAGEAYNVVDDEPVMLRDFLAELAAATGAPRPWSVPAWAIRLVAPYLATVFGTVLRASNAKAKRELGWSPSCPTYRQGLAKVAASLRDGAPVAA